MADPKLTPAVETAVDGAVDEAITTEAPALTAAEPAVNADLDKVTEAVVDDATAEAENVARRAERAALLEFHELRNWLRGHFGHIPAVADAVAAATTTEDLAAAHQLATAADA